MGCAKYPLMSFLEVGSSINPEVASGSILNYSAPNYQDTKSARVKLLFSPFPEVDKSWPK
jgi:hypothetical protein